ncbi:MAG: gamma-glutamylcyclotransferase [Myxococcaceae bacterium]|nr:MAG: gamma-glutamylcyclotransferase [Myxococcaceae bacterium]
MKRTSTSATRVFVYGTLLSGEPNHHLLRGARLVGPAQTLPRFTLYDYGPFPALASGGQHTVAGEVYEVDAPMLAALDRLEGHPRFYQRSPITLDGRARVEAYLFPKARLTGRPIIESGCWRRHLQERKSW